MPDFHDVRTVARELKITPRAVLHRITAGTIAATKVGDSIRSAYVITAAELARLEAERDQAEGPGAA